MWCHGSQRIRILQGTLVFSNPKRPIKMKLLRLTLGITMVPFIIPISVEYWSKSQSFKLWMRYSDTKSMGIDYYFPWTKI